ncbi:hypothetical protein G3580_17710 [Nitrogeniibacter mangrovi]|uniref:Uncharacterized protein n=1 Tax=Nitrogeniibacter mangrovi TaxID=2016596 RepID=A0A6C1BA87_9RHOO|nr:hypothetical protein [Nitrogeniibacter mangrovi]QID19290.1 hypothetical protein G3580_17710 [Nitrogeniibacter mangrovi]
MSDAQLEPVKIAAPWMDERSHGMLRTFFRDGLKSRCVLVEPDRAQAILIDVDRGDATRRLHDARLRWPEVPVIELSVNHPDQALFVRKPLRPKGMARALMSVRRKLRLSDDPVAESVGVCPGEAVDGAPATAVAAPRGPVPEPGTENHYVGQASDLDPAAPANWSRAHYDPAQFLQGHLQRAAAMADATGRRIAMTGVWGCWMIPPGNGAIELSMPDQYLRSLCLVTMNDSEVRLDAADAGADLTCSPEQTPRDVLLWKVALWTARGRVPLDAPLDAPVYLRHWPDLNELLVTPDAMRIAALWLNHPISLFELATRLDVPQRHVFSFYSACAAIGLAGPARRAADTLIEAPEVGATGMRALLGRLGERLGLGTQTESA